MGNNGRILERGIKICLWICDICCVVLGCIFICQIVVQKAELDTKAQVTLTLEKESKMMHEAANMFKEIKDYRREYREIQKTAADAALQYEAMEEFYNKKLYLDSIAAKMDQPNGSTVYLD